MSSMSGDFERMARSQQLMLTSLRRSNPNLSLYLHRLSCSSFYLYIAQQCDAYCLPHQTLQWLRRAITVDPMSTLSRPGLYILWIKNLARQLLRNSQQAAQRADTSSIHTSVIPMVRGDTSHGATACAVIAARQKIHRWKIWFRLFISALLHRSLSKV